MGTTLILPTIAICLFAGLRNSEVSTLNWSEVSLTRNLIEIKSENAKSKKRRFIEITPNLAAWLRPFAKESGLMLPVNARDNINLAFKGAKVNKKKNGFRHSYASYHLAHFKDIGTLNAAMGHGNSSMLFGHYRELVLPSEAEKYWQILPTQLKSYSCQ